MSVRKVNADPKDDRYWVRVYNPQGKDYRKIVNGKRTADAHEADIRSRYSSNDFIDPHAGKTTFQRYALGVIDSRDLAPRTRVTYVKACNDLLFPKWGGRQLRSLRHSDAVELSAFCYKHAAKNTAYNALVLARSIMRTATLDGMVARNPFVGEKLGSRKYKPKTMPDWVTCWNVVDGASPTTGALIAALVGSGLRAGEMCGLAVPDVNWLGKRVKVTQQLCHMTDEEAVSAGYRHGGVYLKGIKSEAGQDRVVPLPEWAVQALSVLAGLRPEPQRLRVGAPDSEVWQTIDLLVPVTPPATMSARVGSTFRRTTGDRFSPHALRHLYATTLEQAGVPLRTLQSVMGHEPVGVTLSTYVHVTEASYAMVRDVLNGVRPVGQGPAVVAL